MDCSLHTVTKYLSDEKTHSAIESIVQKATSCEHFIVWSWIAKAQIKHKEPIIIGFFILQYAKQWILEMNYNFFTEFGDVKKLEELEKDKF